MVNLDDRLAAVFDAAVRAIFKANLPQRIDEAERFIEKLPELMKRAQARARQTTASPTRRHSLDRRPSQEPPPPSPKFPTPEQIKLWKEAVQRDDALQGMGHDEYQRAVNELILVMFLGEMPCPASASKAIDALDAVVDEVVAFMPGLSRGIVVRHAAGLAIGRMFPEAQVERVPVVAQTLRAMDAATESDVSESPEEAASRAGPRKSRGSRKGDVTLLRAALRKWHKDGNLEPASREWMMIACKFRKTKTGQLDSPRLSRAIVAVFNDGENEYHALCRRDNPQGLWRAIDESL